jgi:hypothetical protein
MVFKNTNLQIEVNEGSYVKKTFFATYNYYDEDGDLGDLSNIPNNYFILKFFINEDNVIKIYSQDLLTTTSVKLNKLADGTTTTTYITNYEPPITT